MRDEARSAVDVSPSPDEDPAVATLIREVADDWRMPPQRLGEPTWRERVRTDRRGSALRPAFVAAALAAAATVVLALGAVWLSTRPLPSGAVGASPSAAQEASPTPASSGVTSPTAGPNGTPLPGVAISDPALRSVTFPVRADEQRMLDLSRGLGTASLDGTAGYPPELLRYGAGTVCLCARRAASTGPGTILAVDLVERDRAGSAVRTVQVATYGPGLSEPAVGGSEPVAVSTSAGPSPTQAYLGWSIRRADGWASGVDLVDLRTGTVLESVHLPTWPLTTALTDVGGPVQRPSFADAPTVYLSPSGARAVIEQIRGGYAEAPGGTLGDGVRKGPDHWSAQVSDGRLGALTTFASGDGTLDPSACGWSSDEALVSDDVFVATCPPGSSFAIRRVDLGGRPLGDVEISPNAQGFVAMIDAPSAVRYVWLPFSRLLFKLDLASGKILGRLEIPAPTAAAPGLDGLLARLGSWIAPSAMAKVDLQPALAISPDGSRLYVLGTLATGFTETGGGSAGIAVVDTASMSIVARWKPTADFASIGVSRDGTFIYAAGLPGIDASGTQRADQGASVTVFRASDGSVAGILGQLGATPITFVPGLMP